MSSSVELSDRAKSRLERLRAEIRDETGRELSQRELLDRLVEREYDSKEALIDSFREESGTRSDDWEGLSEDEIDAFLSGTSDWGFETSEEEIDDVLYGK